MTANHTRNAPLGNGYHVMANVDVLRTISVQAPVYGALKPTVTVSACISFARVQGESMPRGGRLFVPSIREVPTPKPVFGMVVNRQREHLGPSLQRLFFSLQISSLLVSRGYAVADEIYMVYDMCVQQYSVMKGCSNDADAVEFDGCAGHRVDPWTGA